jgi:hypothetical protein
VTKIEKEKKGKLSTPTDKRQGVIDIGKRMCVAILREKYLRVGICIKINKQ